MHCVIFSWSLFMDACKHLYYRDMEFWWSITVCILRLFFSYHNFFPVRYGHYFIWDQCLWTLCLKKLSLKSCCWDMKWGHLRFYYMHDRNQPMHACMHAYIIEQSACVLNRDFDFFPLYCLSTNFIILTLPNYSHIQNSEFCG